MELRDKMCVALLQVSETSAGLHSKNSILGMCSF